MKKLLIIIITILMITTLAITLVACTDYDDEGRVVLKTPKLTVNANTVSWSSIKNAEKYGIVINDDESNEITITGTTYTVVLGGTNNIRVRAIGDLKKYGYSAYSENASVTTAGKLISPTMNDAVINPDGSATFSWSTVEGAGAYRLEVKSEGTTLVNEDIAGNEYTLNADSLKNPAYYSYRVKAISAGEDADSEFTIAKNFSKQVTISAPEAPKQSSSTSTSNKSAFIEFTAPEYANRYTIEAYNNDRTIEYSINLATSAVQINIENIPIKEPGEYKVRIRAEHKTNNLCAPSEFVEVMKEDGTTPLTLTLYGAPKNIKFKEDNKTLTWDAVADDVKYVLSYASGTNTTTTDSIDGNKTEFDLSTSSRIKAEHYAGLLVDVTMYVGKDLGKGILDGLKSDIINYSHVEKPTLLTEGNFNGYYEVDSIAKLNYINTEPTAKYVLIKNIDCANGIITPITKEFKGILDGNDYSINRFTLKLPKGDTRTYISLFGNIAIGAEIKNIGIFDATVTVNDSQRISAGLISNINNGLISDVNVKATINVQNTAAAVALENKGNITNVFFSGTISGNNTVGAIAANNSGTITNARVFTSTLSTASIANYANHVYLGGIVGINTGTIKYAGIENTTMTALTYVPTHNVYLGGIAGRSAGSISTAFVNSTGRTITARTDASGNTSKAYSAGLVGELAGSIEDCYAINGTYVSANYTATFAGEILDTASISNSYTANLTLNSHKNYIVSNTIGNRATLKNLYYFNRNNDLHLSSAESEIAAITKINNRADMNDSSKVNISSMSKNTLVQDEFMTLNDMLYFAKGATYVNSATKSSLADRIPGKVYSGNAIEADKVVKFDSVKATSGTTTYDIYTKELSNGIVIKLTKSFKITN